MQSPASISVSDPEGIALLLGVALFYFGIRFLPRLLVGVGSYVSPAALTRLLATNRQTLVLDVRTPAEYWGETGHIRGALNIPLAQLKQHLASADSSLLDYRNRPVIAVCRTDNRAVFAVRVLRKRGFKHVLVLSGGMLTWRENGYPVQ